MLHEVLQMFAQRVRGGDNSLIDCNGTKNIHCVCHGALGWKAFLACLGNLVESVVRKVRVVRICESLGYGMSDPLSFNYTLSSY